MQYIDDTYRVITETLVDCYRKIDWTNSGSKNAHDYFANRVKNASKQVHTLPAFISQLAKNCNVPGFEFEPDNLAELDKIREVVLKRLRTEFTYIALLVAKYNRESKP